MSTTTTPNSRINQMPSSFAGYMRSFDCPGYVDADEVQHECGRTVTTQHPGRRRCDGCSGRKENAGVLRRQREKQATAREAERKGEQA
jgi:hypothetical protein